MHNNASRYYAEVIRRLEKPNPDDDFPAATRGTLAYMRILEARGPQELMEALHANISASVAVLAILTPTPQEAMLVYAELTVKVIREMKASLATATEGTPK